MGSLYGRYDSMWFFWELLNLGSKLLLTSSVFLFSDESSVNALRQVRLSMSADSIRKRWLATVFLAVERRVIWARVLSVRRFVQRWDGPACACMMSAKRSSPQPLG